MRRVVTTVVVGCLLVLGVGSGPTGAQAAESTTGFTVDQWSPGSPGVATVTTYAGATASTAASVPGSLTLNTAAGSLLVAPPTNGHFAAGDAIAVKRSADRTDSQGALGFPSGCSNAGVSGILRVVSASYDVSETLTSLAATYDVGCAAALVASRYSGAIQFNAALTFNHGAAAWGSTDAAAESRQSPVGVADAQIVMVTNRGPDATTTGTPAFSGVHAADYAIASDGCAGKSLSKDDTCTIEVTFVPAAAGTRRAILSIPMSGHPRVAGTLFDVVGTGVVAPSPPIGFAQYAAIGGVGLTWRANNTGDKAMAFRVYRRDTSGDPWVQIAEVEPHAGPFGPPVGSYLDSDIASGTTADYAVSAVGLAGEGAQTAPTTATRSSSDPVPGTTDALAAEFWNSRFRTYDTRRSGETVVFSVGMLQAQNGSSDGSSNLDLPVVPSAGIYTVVPADATPGPGQVQMDVSSANTSCTPSSGTWTVHEVAFDPDLMPLVYSAQLDAQCGSLPVHATVRWHSSRPYRAADVSPLTVPAHAPVGTPTPGQPITVTNRGDAPLAVTVPVPTGTASADWSISNGCSPALDPGATCTIETSFTPAVGDTRNAALAVGLDTAGGPRTIALLGTGGTRPGAPAISLVTAVLGRVQVRWTTPGEDGSTGVTGFTVYRKVSTSTVAPVPVGTTGDTHLDDRTAVPGLTYAYAVSATTEAGEGPPSAAVTARSVSTGIVAIRRDRFSGAGTLTVWAPNGSGWVDLEDSAPEHATPTVSPDGRWVVYARADVFNEAANYDLWKRRVDGGGTPVQLTALPGDEIEPAWSPNGSTIAYTYLPPTGPPEVWTIPVAGGTAVQRAADSGDPSWLPDSSRLVAVDGSLATTRLVLISSTGTKTPISGTTNGRAPAVSPDGTRIAFNIDRPAENREVAAVVAIAGGIATPVSDLVGDYGYLAWRHDGKSVLAERWSDAWNTSGIVAISTVNGSYGSWTEVVRHGFDDDTEPSWGELDRSAPVVTVTSPAPTATTTLASSVTVSYKASDRLGVTSYDVRYRKASYSGSFGAYISPPGWSATTATSRTLAVAPGYEYCFSVRARDAVDNVSGWTPERCVSAPLDDRSLAQSGGWSRATGSAYYRSTVTRTTTGSASLTRTGVKTRRITLLVTKCPTCGSMNVYWGGTRISSISLYASTKRDRQLFTVPLLSTVRAGTLTLRSTSSRKPVRVDGVAFRRS